MAEDCLEIEYSPILKEKIRIIKNGEDVPSDMGVWQDVFNKLKTKDGKYKFLQEVEKDFFDCLYKACFGSSPDNTVNINMKTTKEVYEEFKAMAEWYNSKSNDRKIVLQKLTELLPNEEVCRLIMEKTKETKQCLENELQNPQNYDSNVVKILQENTEILNNALETVAEDNTVSILVTGVYSSGKSTFINALVGEEILESDDDPSTAAVFTLKKIKKNEPKKIEFTILGSQSEKIVLVFNGAKFTPETEISNQIDELLTQLNGNEVEQIRKISAFLNKKIQKFVKLTSAKTEEERNEKIKQYSDLWIENDVTISYPFDFGGDIPVKICDTPGTNSSFRDDSKTLKDAIGNQKNSILITLLTPTKSDDRQGNKVLFNIFEEAEKENTYIDKSRLIFVWNQIDGDSCDKDKIDKKKEKILEIDKVSEDDNKSSEIQQVKLSDYPVYFISAKRALTAQCLLKNPDNPSAEKKYKNSDVDINLSEECSLGWNTARMQEAARKALEDAGNDEYQRAKVMSGLFAVKQGITDYINKYSSAIVSNGQYMAIKIITDELDVKIKKAKNQQETVKNDEDAKFHNKKTDLENLVKKVCESERQGFGNTNNNDAILTALDSAIEKRINELPNEEVNHPDWWVSKKLNVFYGRFNETNKIIVQELSRRLKNFVNDKITEQNKKIEDETLAAYNRVTEKLKVDFETTMDSQSWEVIKNGVMKDVTKVNELKIPLLKEDWFYKIQADDFVKTAKQVAQEQTGALRASIKSFSEKMSIIMERIKESYLGHLEEYSKELKRLRENAEEENRKFEYLNGLHSFLEKECNDIETAIFLPR